jgi:predicted molibdopterin-dependent oxidoreductase YjgC
MLLLGWQGPFNKMQTWWMHDIQQTYNRTNICRYTRVRSVTGDAFFLCQALARGLLRSRNVQSSPRTCINARTLHVNLAAVPTRRKNSTD